MVVCPEPPAARAGQDIFAAGGNAIDAAVAAAFAQAVTNPLLCGLGGTGHLYLYEAGPRRRLLLDFEGAIGSAPVPESWRQEFVGRAETIGRYIIHSEANQIGHQSVMVPGLVRALWIAHQRFGSGRVSWADALRPAQRLAGDGFDVYPYIAAFWTNTESRPGYPGLLKKLRQTPEVRRIFLRPDGSAYREGDRFVQADLARTLERLATAGGEDFYTGHIGAAIADDFERHEGLLTREDIRGFPVLEQGVHSGQYRGLEVTSGPDFIEMLQILEHFDLQGLGHNTPQYIDIFARAQRATFADYVRLKGMETDAAVPVQRTLMSPERAAYWAGRIKQGDRIMVEGGAVDPGTTHLTCVDTERNVVGINHSIGSLAGSGVVTPGLGFIYNNFLGHFNPLPGRSDSITPHKRLVGVIATLVFREGEPYIAIGSPGGSRLISSIVQTIVNVIDHGMDMRTAVTVPRFHSEERQIIFMEPHLPESTAQALRALGNEVHRSTYMARVQAILIRPDTGELEAGADPRGGAGIGRWPPGGGGGSG
jgi:gamma-glutamyltranspeptidase/glutathione hydrolase